MEAELAEEALQLLKLFGVAVGLVVFLFGPIDVLRSRRTDGLGKLGWVVLTICLPLVGWLIYRAVQPSSRRRLYGRNGLRACSVCATESPAEAVSCHHCGRQFTPANCGET